MKWLVLAVAVVLLGAVALWQVARERSESATDIDALRPGKYASRRATAPCDVASIAAALEDRGARFGRRTNDELIAFVGSLAAVAKVGALNVKPEQVPLRVFVRARDGGVEIGVDDHLGRGFMGPARWALEKVAAAACEAEESRLRAAVESGGLDRV